MSTRSTTPEAQFQAVYFGQACLGHILTRGKQGVEAFDLADRSIGMFGDVGAAATAVVAAAKSGGAS